jgi:predicted nucleotidyltransferase
MNRDNITRSIQDKLKELEQAHQIEILFACESGSRAWGFPSWDSDYDVRFIYRHSKDWYLSLFEDRDVIEVPVNPLLDINGWDLKKALKLLAKHNAVLAEWIQSPIIYAEEPSFKEAFFALAKTSFSPLAGFHHYHSIAKKYYEKCILEDKVKLKSYFYCLRATLAALWIRTYKTIPPMELQALLVVISDKHALIDKIHQLQRLKVNCSESYIHPREPELDLFLMETINQTPILPDHEPNIKEFNPFFLRWI